MPHNTRIEATATELSVPTDSSAKPLTRLSSDRLAIESKPSWEKFKEREALLAAFDYSALPIPAEFPHRVVSQSVWTPKELKIDDITFTLSSADIEELETALNSFQCTLLYQAVSRRKGLIKAS
jgi:hypothetical protein